MIQIFAKCITYILVFIISFISTFCIPDVFAKQENNSTHDMGVSNVGEVDDNDQSDLDLEYVIQEAINSNPEILATGQRWEAAKKRIKIATSLDDPTLKVGKMNARGNPFNFGSEPVSGSRIMSPTTFGIAQKIPFPGKLKLRGKVASEAAQMEKKVVEGKVQQIIADVKLAYYELFLIHKSIEINEENRNLLQNFTEIAESMYSVGKVSQRDVLAAMVELSKSVNEITVLNQKKRSLEARLNNLLNRKQGSHLGRPKDFKKHRILFTYNELEEIALKSRPVFLKTKHAVRKNRFNLDLAKKDYFSDFTAMVEYRRIDADPSDTWASSLTINIPWLWSKQRYKVKEAKDELSAAIADTEAVNNQTIFEVRDLVSRLIAAESTVNLFKTSVIPQASQALDAARVGYETGTIDFLTLIDSQRTLLDSKLQYYKALTEYEQNLARMERVVGIELIKKEK